MLWKQQNSLKSQNWPLHEKKNNGFCHLKEILNIKIFASPGDTFTLIYSTISNLLFIQYNQKAKFFDMIVLAI